MIAPLHTTRPPPELGSRIGIAPERALSQVAHRRSSYRRARRCEDGRELNWPGDGIDHRGRLHSRSRSISSGGPNGAGAPRGEEQYEHCEHARAGDDERASLQAGHDAQERDERVMVKCALGKQNGFVSSSGARSSGGTAEGGVPTQTIQ